MFIRSSLAGSNKSLNRLNLSSGRVKDLVFTLEIRKARPRSQPYRAPRRAVVNPKEDTVRQQPKTAPAGGKSCYTCGRPDHRSDKCALKDHPDANRDRTEWKNSTAGKKFAALNKDRLPWTKRLNDKGELVDWAEAPPSTGGSKHAVGSSNKTKGINLNEYSEYWCFIF